MTIIWFPLRHFPHLQHRDGVSFLYIFWLAHMAHSVILFPYPGDIFAHYPSKDNHSLPSPVFPFTWQLNTISFTKYPQMTLSAPLWILFEIDTPFMTPDIHITTSWLFEEEEAANMPNSAYSMDGRACGHGCMGDVDRVTIEEANMQSVYGEWRSWLRCLYLRKDQAARHCQHTLPLHPTFSCLESCATNLEMARADWIQSGRLASSLTLTCSPPIVSQPFRPESPLHSPIALY